MAAESSRPHGSRRVFPVCPIGVGGRTGERTSGIPATLSETAARHRVSPVSGAAVALFGPQALLAQYEKTYGEVCKALVNTAERAGVAELANVAQAFDAPTVCWNCTCGYTSQSGAHKGTSGCTTSSLG